MEFQWKGKTRRLPLKDSTLEGSIRKEPDGRMQNLNGFFQPDHKSKDIIRPKRKNKDFDLYICEWSSKGRPKTGKLRLSHEQNEQLHTSLPLAASLCCCRSTPSESRDPHTSLPRWRGHDARVDAPSCLPVRATPCATRAPAPRPCSLSPPVPSRRCLRAAA